MSTPQHLSLYIENGDIANNLQLRKLQMYVKMVAYWIEEYPAARVGISIGFITNTVTILKSLSAIRGKSGR
jgi:hypothetical protein